LYFTGVLSEIICKLITHIVVLGLKTVLEGVLSKDPLDDNSSVKTQRLKFSLQNGTD